MQQMMYAALFGIALILVGCTVHVLDPIPTGAAPAKVDFARDVQPIFAQNCYSCHGPEKQRAGLRLDNKADAMKGSEYGPVIVPGDSAGSELVGLIQADDAEKRMPQKADPLSADQIALLKRWIDEGAAWPE